jgi:hypothetical protein
VRAVPWGVHPCIGQIAAMYACMHVWSMCYSRRCSMWWQGGCMQHVVDEGKAAACSKAGGMPGLSSRGSLVCMAMRCCTCSSIHCHMLQWIALQWSRRMELCARTWLACCCASGLGPRRA